MKGHALVQRVYLNNFSNDLDESYTGLKVYPHRKTADRSLFSLSL